MSYIDFFAKLNLNFGFINLIGWNYILLYCHSGTSFYSMCRIRCTECIFSNLTETQNVSSEAGPSKNDENKAPQKFSNE